VERLRGVLGRCRYTRHLVIYRFASFELDRSQYRLSRERAAIPIKPQVVELLAFLMEHRDRVVSKEELLTEIWKGRFVSEGALTEAIHEARRALGEDAAHPVYIKTLHGRGYQFLFRPVSVCTDKNSSESAESTAAFLSWSGGRTRLQEGENIIGRDPAVVVVLEGLRVSRHHARLVVKSDMAVVEDLGSKNGTALNGKRLSAPTLLSDGDMIEIGDVALTFQYGVADQSTMTSTEPWPGGRDPRAS
jgi:DNA-binding winged helix-turn-helix (wHTH) protein